MFFRLAICGFIGIFVSGCAVGNTTQFNMETVSVDIKSEKTLAVGSLDARPYIVTKDKTPDFVGLQRGGFGNPFDVTTTSKMPLSADITATLVSAMKRTGIDAEPVILESGRSKNDAVSALLKTDSDQYLLMIVKELKSDTFYNTAFMYDLTLQVLNKSGANIAQTSISGRDNMGMLGGPSSVGPAVATAFQKKLEEMLADPKIIAALE